MGLIQISGWIAGIIAIIGGILVIVKPKILAWVVGLYFIIFGVFAIINAIRL